MELVKILEYLDHYILKVNVNFKQYLLTKLLQHKDAKIYKYIFLKRIIFKMLVLKALHGQLIKFYQIMSVLTLIELL